MLQHRGQDSAGMVTTDGDCFHEHKENGLVRDVFGSQHIINTLQGAASDLLGPRGRTAAGNKRACTEGCSPVALLQGDEVAMAQHSLLCKNMQTQLT